LKEWFIHVRRGVWLTPKDFKEEFPSCVIFHIKGNNYRLIVFVNYKAQRMYVKFIGTHAEYDKIDATTINQF